jgi:hypothetical protein
MNGPAVQSTPDGVEYQPPAAPASKGTCQSVDIEKTANGGFTARCRYKQPPSKKGDMGPSYVEPETYAFSTFAELTTFLQSELGGGAASNGAGNAPASSDDSDVENY